MVYIWVYLFKTINELQNAFVFNTGEENPEKTKSRLINLLIISITLDIITIIIAILAVLQVLAPSVHAKNIWMVVSIIIELTFFIKFWSSFVKLISVSQLKAGIIPLNTTFFLLEVLTLIMFSLAIFFYVFKVYPFFIVYSILLLFTVNEVNRIWKRPESNTI